jgi:hypothetical protein
MERLLTPFLIMTTAATFAQNAATTKTTFHRETSVVTVIKADEAIIWALLTNASDYPRWNSTVTFHPRQHRPWREDRAEEHP